MVRSVAVLACFGGAVAWAMHDSTQWVHVVSATAENSAATVVMLAFDACVLNAPVTVTETDTEVRVSVDRRWDPDGDNLACLSGQKIDLQSPLGSRLIVDAHGGSEVPITIASPPTPPTPISGSVADVVGQQAPATVTGWLVVYEGLSLLCDDLSDDGTSGVSASIEVDFSYSPDEQPTDLVTRGEVRVSRHKVTFTGSLKYNFLYVGVTP